MTGMQIKAEPLTAEAFIKFGDIIAMGASPDKIINQGKCARYHDLAALAFTEKGVRVSACLTQNPDNCLISWN